MLNYSLILRIDDSGPCHSIPATNKFILERHRDALAALAARPGRMAGPNRPRHWRPQVRRQRPAPPPALPALPRLLPAAPGPRACVEKILPLPSRQPDYRVNRSHTDFLINLNVPAHTIKSRPRQGLGRHRAAGPNPLRPDHPPGPREIRAGRVELQVLAARPAGQSGFSVCIGCATRLRCTHERQEDQVCGGGYFCGHRPDPQSRQAGFALLRAVSRARCRVGCRGRLGHRTAHRRRLHLRRRGSLPPDACRVAAAGATRNHGPVGRARRTAQLAGGRCVRGPARPAGKPGPHTVCANSKAHTA